MPEYSIIAVIAATVVATAIVVTIAWFAVWKLCVKDRSEYADTVAALARAHFDDWHPREEDPEQRITDFRKSLEELADLCDNLPEGDFRAERVLVSEQECDRLRVELEDSRRQVSSMLTRAHDLEVQLHDAKAEAVAARAASAGIGNMGGACRSN